MVQKTDSKTSVNIIISPTAGRSLGVAIDCTWLN